MFVTAQKTEMNCETVSLPKPQKYILKDVASNRNTLNYHVQ